MSYVQHAPNAFSVPAAARRPTALFSSPFFPAALFGGISLVVLLIAVLCNEQGVWL
jgi:hypothetical protein